jgi:hypothetical protein
MTSNDVQWNIFRPALATFLSLALGLSLLAAPTPRTGSQGNLSHRKIMIVGVAHLVAKTDLHNSSFDDPLGLERQKQIAEFIARLATFHPTKVMIEAPFGNTEIQEQYQQYLKGAYDLGASQNYQFGFRLAGLAKNARIYPIDSQGFPFDFDSVKKSAEQNRQSSLLEEAEAATKPLRVHEKELVEKGTMLDLVRYLSTDEALDRNASWYLFIDRIGWGNDYAGADLVASWYARNLHIFANILRLADSPDDRVVVFIGAGHVKLLRDYLKLSPDLELVDSKTFLDQNASGH